MDQETVSFLKALILPPGGIVLLGLIGLMLGRRFLGKLLILTSFAALYMFSTPHVSTLLMTGLEPYPALDDQAIADAGAQAIVVLSGGRYSDAPEYGGDTVNQIGLARIRYAAWLSRKTRLPVVPSGGSVSDKDRIAEGILAAGVLNREFGVRTTGVGQQSQNTWDNAFMTGKMLDELGIHRVFLVTHAWHMPRALEVFERAGVAAIPAPTAFVHKGKTETKPSDWYPSAGALLNSYFALHEYLGRVWYRLRDRLRQSGIEI